MSFLYGDSPDGLDLFLTRVRNWVVGWAPACLVLVWFLTKEEGWHMSFLALCVLPPVAAYLGIRAKREILAGLAWTAGAVAVAPLPLIAAIELL
ncbi:hypothetical protein J7I98_08505 [Streptomyces sp. ISL-98]|uniref:hypothetical protein n=1 Tax=Streptomyces sp. ISL-98 TaxID=2819192 RepID=UPI001BE7AF10|nr:hypothetical protein [Streptomyces sp. ISL-98]MBT2505933.1 hypothetical protein [Streptomyces sp. ISL-98]